jgi:hypothetical protein
LIFALGREAWRGSEASTVGSTSYVAVNVNVSVNDHVDDHVVIDEGL